LSDDLIRLERLTLDLWPARERTTLDGWTLTAGEGRVHRTNAVWPLGWTGNDVDHAIDRVEAWYAARGLPPAFKIVEGAHHPPGLVDRLAARDYAPGRATLVMTAPVAGFLRPRRTPVQLDDRPGAAMRQVFAASSADPVDRDERLSILARVPQPAAFASVEADGEPVACGLGAVRDGHLLVAAMRTHPDHRRRGHAAAILATLADWAMRQGAATLFLQVEELNDAARALYGPPGMAVGRYATWKRNS
jgi:GNAT superfamily N-acetyltransferase